MAPAVSTSLNLPSHRLQRSFLWGGLAAAVLVGAVMGLTSYDSGPAGGAGYALLVALIPLALFLSIRHPIPLFIVLAGLIAIDDLSFLTGSIATAHLIGVAAMALLTLRVARIDWQQQRGLIGWIAAVWFLSFLNMLFHPSSDGLVVGVMWCIPFLGIFIGYGLIREDRDRAMDAWYTIASFAGLVICAGYLVEQFQAGFVVKSYVVQGIYGNANMTSSVLGLCFPTYLAMTRDRRAPVQFVGLVMAALGLTGLLIVVSRVALVSAIVAPVLFYSRGGRVLLSAIVAG
ncbi:MAG: hypothetical protein ABI743_15310, partial [bacterium]